MLILESNVKHRSKTLTQSETIEVQQFRKGQYRSENVEEFFNVIGKNGKTRTYWNTCNLVDIITPAPEKLPESWITDYKESFETLVKKKSEEILKKGMDSEYDPPNLWSHVQNWK